MAPLMLRVADGVGVETFAGVVFVAPLPDGPILVLEGAAALIWTEGCTRPRSDVVASVAEQTDQDAASIALHVDQFLDEMIARGLLVEV